MSIKDVGRRLHISDGNTIEYAEKLLDKVKMACGFDRFEPKGMIACCLYLSCIIFDEKINQGVVARECGVTSSTIRNWYKKVLDKLDLENVNLGGEKYECKEE